VCLLTRRYDTIHPLDGLFDDNVIVQIKHTPVRRQHASRNRITYLQGAILHHGFRLFIR
jgi:alpha-glucuronidase